MFRSTLRHRWSNIDNKSKKQHHHFVSIVIDNQSVYLPFVIVYTLGTTTVHTRLNNVDLRIKYFKIRVFVSLKNFKCDKKKLYLGYRIARTSQ